MQEETILPLLCQMVPTDQSWSISCPNGDPRCLSASQRARCNVSFSTPLDQCCLSPHRDMSEFMIWSSRSLPRSLCQAMLTQILKKIKLCLLLKTILFNSWWTKYYHHGAVTHGILSHHTSRILPATSLWLEFSFEAVERQRLEKSAWLDKMRRDNIERWSDISMG